MNDSFSDHVPPAYNFAIRNRAGFMNVISGEYQKTLEVVASVSSMKGAAHYLQRHALPIHHVTIPRDSPLREPFPLDDDAAHKIATVELEPQYHRYYMKLAFQQVAL